jgi:WD40 repeat protein
MTINRVRISPLISNVCILLLLLCRFISMTTAQTPKLVVPVGHNENIFSAAFSKDGQFLLTGSYDNNAILWRISDGLQLRTLAGHHSWVSAVAFSPDDRYLLTASTDGSAKLWSPEGKELFSFNEHTQQVTSAVFSPVAGENLALTGSYDKTAKLWDFSGRVLQNFEGHCERINIVAFSPDGQSIVTGSEDKTVRLWDREGRETGQLLPGASVTAIAFSPACSQNPQGGKYLLIGLENSTVQLWEVQNKTLIRSFSGHTSGVRSVNFSPDGATIITASYDNTARLWDINGRKLFSIPAFVVATAIFSPSGQYILTAGRDAILWNKSCEEKRRFKAKEMGISSAVFYNTDNETSVLFGSRDNSVRNWNLSTGMIRNFKKTHTFEVTSVEVYAGGTGNGPRYISGSGDNNAIIWNLNGLPVSILKHSTWVLDVALSPDGNYALTGCQDSFARLWDIHGNMLQSFKHGAQVRSVAFSPPCLSDSTGGQFILTGGTDGKINLWDKTGNLLRVFEGHSGYQVNAVAFSPDRKFILTGDSDSKVILWNIDGGEVRNFHSSGAVTAVALSPVQTGVPKDKRFLLVGNTDKVAQLWDMQSGFKTQTFSGHTFQITSTGFYQNGGKLFLWTCSGDNTIKIWESTESEEIASLIPLNAKDWVVTTPSGLFDASPGAMKLMHYVQGLK